MQVNARDRWGGTALADAMRGGHAIVSRTLRDHGAELRLELQPYVPELLPCASRLHPTYSGQPYVYPGAELCFEPEAASSELIKSVCSRQ